MYITDLWKTSGVSFKEMIFVKLSYLHILEATTEIFRKNNAHFSFFLQISLTCSVPRRLYLRLHNRRHSSLRLPTYYDVVSKITDETCLLNDIYILIRNNHRLKSNGLGHIS